MRGALFWLPRFLCLTTRGPRGLPARPTLSAVTISLSPEEFAAFLADLYERGERLERREAGGHYAPDEAVDAYAFSAHVEALNTEEIDGELLETASDLGLPAPDEARAWDAIRAWYLERGCVLLQVGADEYLLSEALAGRLKLV